MRWGYAIAVLLGVVVVVFAGTLRSGDKDDSQGDATVRQGAGMASLVPPPATMDELVRTSDVIVLGRIIEVIDERDEGPYADNSMYPGDSGEEADVDATPTPRPPLFTFTYYSVAIQHIVADRAGRLEHAGMLTLRISGSAEEDIAFSDMMPMPQPGDVFLFALMLNPDGETFGSGPWGLIHVDGEVPRYNDWERTPITFAEGMSPEEFVTTLSQN